MNTNAANLYRVSDDLRKAAGFIVQSQPTDPWVNFSQVTAAKLVNDSVTLLNTISTNITQVQATLTTNLTGATNNDVVFTAVPLGVLGNAVSITYADPGGVTATLGVVVSGSDITINLGRATSAVTTTGTLIASIIAGDTGASALVTVANKAGNDGTGLVAALTKTNLSGGLN